MVINAGRWTCCLSQLWHVPAMCLVLGSGDDPGPDRGSSGHEDGAGGDACLCWEGRAGYELVALQLSLPPRSQSYLRVIPVGIILYAIYF